MAVGEQRNCSNRSSFADSKPRQRQRQQQQAAAKARAVVKPSGLRDCTVRVYKEQWYVSKAQRMCECTSQLCVGLAIDKRRPPVEVRDVRELRAKWRC